MKAQQIPANFVELARGRSSAVIRRTFRIGSETCRAWLLASGLGDQTRPDQPNKVRHVPDDFAQVADQMTNTALCKRYGAGSHTITFGSLHDLSDFTDGAVDQAPAFKLTFAPASNAAAIALSSPAMQGSPIQLSLGIIVPATGLFVDTPELILAGQLDFTTLRGGANSRLLEIEVTADTELFFRGDDGRRLSDAWHQMVWPGETGLGQVSGILQQFWWGQAPLTGVTR